MPPPGASTPKPEGFTGARVIEPLSGDLADGHVRSSQFPGARPIHWAKTGDDAVVSRQSEGCGHALRDGLDAHAHFLPAQVTVLAGQFKTSTTRGATEISKRFGATNVTIWSPGTPETFSHRVA